MTAAKQAGSVESLIKMIEKPAVSKAAPAIYAKGLGTSAALASANAVLASANAVLAVSGVGAGKKYLDQQKADQKAAEKAKTQLASEIAVPAGEVGSRGQGGTLCRLLL